MRDWQAFLPPDERTVYEQAGYGRAQSIGRTPALVVIDCTIAFTGSKPQPLTAAMAEYATACGPVAWEALPRIRELLGMFRGRGLPVVYTRSDLAARRALRAATKAERKRDTDLAGNQIPEIIAPLESEWIMEKARASTFHGTPLTSYLVKRGADSVVICGTSTSGCVRASVVDAFSAGFTVFVVDECCFDRCRTPHLANLWDMNAKYATVVSLAGLGALLAAPPERT